ncbi:MAG TPA: 2-oxoacid:acceptor oxidoreductase family protein [Spirochaetota bacterium]|nr:2-oxoacid:acceptor oxidoreductase family protein [Spirochaetota bacterium]
MLVKILFAGSGGQGVLTMGNILGNAAMLEDFYVTFLPAYGAAMRGGTANCTVSISDAEIASPVASAPDFVVALNHPSAAAFSARLEPGGQMLYNSDLAGELTGRGDVTMFPVPANEIARKIGSDRSANMVMLGAFIKLTNALKVDSIYKSVEYMLGERKKLVEITNRAVEEGYNGFPFGNGSL